VSDKHTVFVLAIDGEPLTPCTPAKARKLMRGGVAKPVWSKFNTFGIQMLVETRRETPQTTVGVDNGTKFEGYAVVCGEENNLAVKLDLPSKKQVVRKMEERQMLRKSRRRRKYRQRRARFSNRKHKNFIAPSQSAIINSRLKILRELFRVYPIDAVAFEDVRFNHWKKRWGTNFSTIEVGKAKLREFFAEQGADLFEFRGWETKALREGYGYRKSSDKAADVFEAHCTDALALACEVGPGVRVEPGPFVVVNDTYRSVRRKLHYTQPAKDNVRRKYSCGTVFGLRKGLLIGTQRGITGQLCGESRGEYRYYNARGERRQTKRLAWVSSHFKTRRIETNSLNA
jgi:hypothetical protein